MSRIGKKPIAIPAGVEVSIQGQEVKVKGKLGDLARTFNPEVSIVRDGATLQVGLREGAEESANLWGLARSLLSNMVVGVSQGFSKTLEIRGVGYRAQVNGRVLNLALGFSHPVDFPLPNGVEASVEKNTIVTLKGADREVLGQTCAEIRDLRPPEPYKGKGVRYVNERVIQKVGKKK